MRSRSLSPVAIFLLLAAAAPGATERGDTLTSLPPVAESTVFFDAEVKFGYRGKVGVYAFPPSVAGTFFDERVRCPGVPPAWMLKKETPVVFPPVTITPLEELLGANLIREVQGELIQQGLEVAAPGESICVMYDLRPGMTFCGAYIILLADLTNYPCLSFMIKGEKGGETFELGMNDTISNKREDAVVAGSIYRYLPGGITTNWQQVVIPIGDFFGADLSRAYSLVFMCNEPGVGRFWIDDFQFHKALLVDRPAEIRRAGQLVADNFDHSDVNLLGQKCGTYKKLPSACRGSRVETPRWGRSGRSLRLEYDRKGTGWCGYYTLLNQIDGKFFDLSRYDAVSFMVRGERGGETFELGMADRNWINIGDSLKAGAVSKYLPGGVSTQWQRVSIPLKDFGTLDFSDMGAFVINFFEKGAGAIYIDDLAFHLKARP